MKDVAQFFKVFADEARLRMLWLLFNQPELCVCDLMAVLSMTQSKASRHLATLRHAGLVVDRKVGTWSYYSLCPIDNDFKRAELDGLRTMLGNHPDAARALRSLEAWMKRKERGGSCVPDADCGPTLPSKPTNRGRVPQKGTSR